MANCKPEQLNKCKSAGVGPSCSQDPGTDNIMELSFDYSSGDFPRGDVEKKQCLEQTEERITKAVSDITDACLESRDRCYEGCAGGGDALTALTCERSCDVAYSNCYAAAASGAVGTVNTEPCYCDQVECPLGKPDLGPIDDGADDDSVTLREVINALKDVDLTVSNSLYDIPIEIVYGTTYMPGNVVWLSEPREFQSTTTTQTFDGTTLIRTTTHTINTYIDLMLGMSAGIIDGVSRIWLDQVLIYDKVSLNTPVSSGITARIFTGSPAQKVVGAIAEVEGFGRVPAYRDMSGIYFTNINLNLLTGFPQFKVELVRSVTADPISIQGADYTGYEIMKVDIPARRVFLSDDTEVVAVDYDTLEEVVTSEAADAIAITVLPNIITQDGSDLSTLDFTNLTVLDTQTDNSAYHSVVRMLDQYNYVTDYLVMMDGATTSIVYQIDDVEGYLIERRTLTAPCKYAVFHSYIDDEIAPGITEVNNSLFLLKESGTDLLINEFIASSTNALQTLWTAIPTTIALGASATIIGIYGSQFTQSLVIFMTDRVLNWSPSEGVLWETLFSEMPTGTIEVRNTHMLFVGFIGSDDVVYSVDVLTGEISAIDVVEFSPAADTVQFYDNKTNTITYLDTDGILTRLFAARVSSVAESLEAVVLDLADRSEISRGDINTTNLAATGVQGFRSGALLTAAAIIGQLEVAYQFRSFVDDRLVFLLNQTSSEVAVDANDLLEPLTFEKNTIEALAKTVTVNYISSYLDGEPWVQSFSLPDEVVVKPNEATYTFTITSDDQSMARLAEFLAVKGLEDSEANAQIRLPVKYLAATPTDTATVRGGMRMVKVTIGADYSLQIDLSVDSTGKYLEQAAVAYTPGLGAAEADDEAPSASPFPLSIHAVAPEQNVAYSTILTGLTDVVGEFDVTDALGYVAASTLTLAVTQDEPILWGRLVSIPPATRTPFTTATGTFVVEFCRDIPVGFFTSITLDQLYLDHTLNRILVGREWIQYQNASVGMDNRTVTFSGALFRARYGTDFALEHEVGDLVIPYHDDIVFRNITGGGQSDNRQPFAGMGGQGVGNIFKRLDLQCDPASLLSQGPCNPLRIDAGGDINLVLGTRNSLWAFSNTLNESSPTRNDDVTAYFLNAPYDESLFNSLYANPDEGTYIIGASSGEGVSGVITPESDFVCVYASDVMASFGFDPETMDLNVVFISNEQYGGGTVYDRHGNRFDTRLIMRWTPGDYTHPRRGLVL